jgi:GWxTD domain-containing protein
LSLGLALHRIGGYAQTGAVFDSATARLDPAERERLFALGRLLARPDSAAHARRPQVAREAAEHAFWVSADPLWSRGGDDPRAEFMARVTFAELRWTVEERNVRGTESDRGEVYIRYGPPDVILAMRGSAFHGTSISSMGQTRPGANQRQLPQRSDVVTWWDYDTGISLTFWGAPP